MVRHGQTDINREGKLQGRRGLPLNDVGVEQANY
ncbi:histidine phosphatase family protein [Paenibacillus sp. FSL H8-0548]|nr:histidine phosphatase family protein [Paenibacillus sp. FSL H8-0548]